MKETVKFPLIQNIFVNIDRFQRYLKDFVIQAEIKTEEE